MTRTFRRVPHVKKVRQSAQPAFIVPIMEFLDVIPNDKVIHRYLFPENSQVISFMINFKGLQDKLKVTADLRVEGGGEFIEVDVEDGINKLLESKNILGGTTVELSIPEYIEGVHGKPKIWISYLYRIVS